MRPASSYTVTVAEAAHRLALSRQRVHGMIADKTLRAKADAHPSHNRLLVHEGDLEAEIGRRRGSAASSVIIDEAH